MRLKVYCKNIENNRIHRKGTGLKVFYGMADKYFFMMPHFYVLLSDCEKRRADHFRFESDYECYVSVHALLRLELSRLMGKDAKSIKIEDDSNGKPFTPDMNLPFSLSRTKNVFAFAIGSDNQLLGVDVEEIKPDIDFADISRIYFSLKEQQHLLLKKQLAKKNRSFYEIWTRKEALLKAIGIGITTDLKKIQVLRGINQIEISGLQIKAGSFSITTAVKDHFIISIASSAESDPVFNNLSF